MGEFVEPARPEGWDCFTPLGYRLDRNAESLGKRTGRFEVRESSAGKHAASLSKLRPAVNDALRLATGVPGYSSLMGTMGERMKALRLSRGLTLDEMGAIMEISGSALSQIENGVTKNVRLDNFLRFCAHFDADPYFVVFGTSKTAATGRFRKIQAP